MIGCCESCFPLPLFSAMTSNDISCVLGDYDQMAGPLESPSPAAWTGAFGNTNAARNLADEAIVERRIDMWRRVLCPLSAELPASCLEVGANVGINDFGFFWKRATGLDNLTWWLFAKS